MAALTAETHERKTMSKKSYIDKSKASGGARPKAGFEKGHAKPEAGTRPRDGKTNLPLESRRKDSLPQAVDIRKK